MPKTKRLFSFTTGEFYNVAKPIGQIRPFGVIPIIRQPFVVCLGIDYIAVQPLPYEIKSVFRFAERVMMIAVCLGINRRPPPCVYGKTGFVYFLDGATQPLARSTNIDCLSSNIVCPVEESVLIAVNCPKNFSRGPSPEY